MFQTNLQSSGQAIDNFAGLCHQILLSTFICKSWIIIAKLSFMNYYLLIFSCQHSDRKKRIHQKM